MASTAPAAAILAAIVATFSASGSTEMTRLVPLPSRQKKAESSPTFAPTSRIVWPSSGMCSA